MNPLKNTSLQQQIGISAEHSDLRIIPSIIKTDFSPLKKVTKQDNLPVLLTQALAHEIRNPLANINLSVSILQFLIANEELNSYLEIIKRSSERINNLVIALLKEQNSGNKPYGKHFVHEVLEDVLEMSKDRIRLKKIKIIKEYAEHDRSFIFNRTGLMIAIANLISNATEAIPPKSGELFISTKFVSNKFIMEIRDNGCGISEDNLQNLFKPYFTTKPDGLGVGLKETFEILQANNIDVKVESELGEGTCFTLIFQSECH